MAGLDDYGALIQSGMNLVPDVNKQMQEQAQTQALRAEAQQNQAQTAAIIQKQNRAQMFQQDLSASDGSPSAVAHLMMKYPEVADHLKDAHNLNDQAVKDADLTTTAEIYSAANSGNWELAQKLAHIRADAEKAAGHSDPAYDAALESMDRAATGSKEDQKGVLNLLGTSLAAATGPEHFSAALNAVGGGDYTLDAGAARFHGGQMTAHSPFIKDADGNIRLWNDAGTPPAAAPGTAPATSGDGGGFDNAVGFTLKHEGGYNPSDRNGSPVNYGINAKANPGVDVKNLTEDQARQIYRDKYWVPSGAEKLPPAMQTPYFDTYVLNPKVAERMLAVSGDDPNKFLQLRQTWLKTLEKSGKYDHAWTQRTADLQAMVNGGSAPAATPGAPPTASGGQFPIAIPGKQPTKITLTDAEATAAGLPPTQKYQKDTATGDISPIPNTTGTAGAPAPGNTALSGPDYINDIRKTNPSLANQVQGVLDTRLAYPPATARTPQAQQLRAAVLQADPTYDEQAYKRRQTTIQQYTPGHTGPGQSMLSAATLINHMYDLAQAARELPDHTFALQNSLSALGARATNQQWLIKYNEGRKFVASELPKFLEGKAPTEGQVSQHYDSYDPSKGKSGIQTALSTDVDYLYGRYQPLLQAYKDNVGKDLKLDTYAPGQVTAAKAAALEYYRANGNLPTVVANPGQAAKLPHGALFATPDGRVLRRH